MKKKATKKAPEKPKQPPKPKKQPADPKKPPSKRKTKGEPSTRKKKKNEIVYRFPFHTQFLFDRIDYVDPNFACCSSHGTCTLISAYIRNKTYAIFGNRDVKKSPELDLFQYMKTEGHGLLNVSTDLSQLAIIGEPVDCDLIPNEVFDMILNEFNNYNYACCGQWSILSLVCKRWKDIVDTRFYTNMKGFYEKIFGDFGSIVPKYFYPKMISESAVHVKDLTSRSLLRFTREMMRKNNYEPILELFFSKIPDSFFNSFLLSHMDDMCNIPFALSIHFVSSHLLFI